MTCALVKPFHECEHTDVPLWWLQDPGFRIRDSGSEPGGWILHGAHTATETLDTHIPPMVTVAQVRSAKAGVPSAGPLAALM